MRNRTEGLSFLYLAVLPSAAPSVLRASSRFNQSSVRSTGHSSRENVTHHNELFQQAAISSLFDPTTQAGLAALSQEIDRQAQMIAYSNSFLVIALAALIMAPLPLFVTKRRVLKGGC